MVTKLYFNARLPKWVLSSFLAFVPKKDSPHSLAYYRPISLIGSVYKIISKLLALRLKWVLGEVILDCQTTLFY